MSNVVENCRTPQPEGFACTREEGHLGPCACVPDQAPDFPPIGVQPSMAWSRGPYDLTNLAPPAPVDVLPQSIFNAFGGNWRWASIDYRGVARVHTFEPKFTPNGRIEVPRGPHNSATCEAFDMVDSPPPSPIWVTRDAGPRGKVTDRFGVILPTGACPLEAADVVQAPTMASLNLEPVPFPMIPPPAPQTMGAPDVPFMNYVVQYRLVGSRVTCNPPPLDTDQDVLCMVHQDNRQVIARAMVAEGFVAEGSWPSDIEAVPSNNSVFESMRKGSMNYIITSDDDFYKRFNAATELAKKLNIMTKAGRIELFQAVLYGNAP